MGLFDRLLGKKGVSEHNREVSRQFIEVLRAQDAGKFLDLGGLITHLREMGADFEKIGSIVCNMTAPEDGSPAPVVGKLYLNEIYR